jgi:general secretion pathway protein L
MSIFRVLLPAPPVATRADAWALFDDAGRCLQRGRDVPQAWPEADRREAVLAADLVRIVALTLPPLPASRVAAAALFALEDQLATSGEAPAIAVSAQQADGTVLASVTARSALASIAALRPPFSRVIVEPALAPVRAGWTWFSSGTGGGFIRRADGSAFAVGAPPTEGALPHELAAALAQAARAGAAPPSVAVAERCDDATLAQWTRAAGLPFTRAPVWRWDAAPPEAFTQAPDLLAGEFARAAPVRTGGVARLFRPALGLAALALAIHVTATLAQWAVLKFDAWRTARAEIALAQDAQLPDATTPAAALRAIARRHAELRHRAGLETPADMLPLLARAAPALAAAPPGALKSAHYAGGAWTIELGALDPTALAALDRGLRNAGVDALQAGTSAGYRMRLTVSP